jgi:hypothetical protein
MEFLFYEGLGKIAFVVFKQVIDITMNLPWDMYVIDDIHGKFTYVLNIAQ